LRRLSREELAAVIRDLEVLREQARQVSEELGVEYSEALLLLILREVVIANKRVEQWLARAGAAETR
jgi:antitoxin component of RelBE/YafQ-DinJ toxin-antitoxin module